MGCSVSGLKYLLHYDMYDHVYTQTQCIVRILQQLLRSINKFIYATLEPCCCLLLHCSHAPTCYTGNKVLRC